MKKADPTQISPWPASQNLGAFCGQIAPMVSVLPVVPVRKYCAVYYLAYGMEEVIGSIPIRSTNIPFIDRDLPALRFFADSCAGAEGC